ncbi:hypothetical protein Agub_g5383, partial [Astrephomene gubernaculifera]
MSIGRPRLGAMPSRSILLILLLTALLSARLAYSEDMSLSGWTCYLDSDGPAGLILGDFHGSQSDFEEARVSVDIHVGSLRSNDSLGLFFDDMDPSVRVYSSGIVMYFYGGDAPGEDCITWSSPPPSQTPPSPSPPSPSPPSPSPPSPSPPSPSPPSPSPPSPSPPSLPPPSPSPPSPPPPSPSPPSPPPPSPSPPSPPPP